MVSGCTISKDVNSFPPDVKTFIENSDNCEYLSGEWDSSLPKQRQIEIERSVETYCGKAKEQREKLKLKYKGNIKVEKKLKTYSFGDVVE